jgi:hypothetical protein
VSNVDDDNPKKCSRCNYDEGDPDEPVPSRFRGWIDAVCHACSVKLRILDERYEDQEAASRDFT